MPGNHYPEGCLAKGEVSQPTLKQLKVFLPVSGFLVVCIFIFSSIETAKLKSALLAADTGWLALSLVVVGILPFLTSVRLYTYLQAGNLPKPYLRCVKAVWAGLSLNAVLPAKGGDLVKVTFLQDSLDELAPLAGLALMERFLDVIILCLLALVSSLYIGSSTSTMISLCGFLALLVILYLVSQSDRIPFVGKKLMKFANAFRTAWESPWLLSKGIFLALVCWITNLTVMFCLLKSVGAQVQYFAVASSTPLAIFVGLLPISISGMGTRDAAMAYFLGYPEKEVVYAGTFLYTAVAYWWLALLGSIFLGKATFLQSMQKAKSNQPS